MNALATASEGKSTHIPYRDSKLTRLLQGCLGGGARTAVGTLCPVFCVAASLFCPFRDSIHKFNCVDHIVLC